MPPPFEPPLTSTEISASLPTVQVVATLTPGGQGAVFKCVTAQNHVGVLKIYSAATQVPRVEREINKLKTIASPFVVKLLDHGSVSLRGQSHLYSVVEYVEGADL